MKNETENARIDSISEVAKALGNGNTEIEKEVIELPDYMINMDTINQLADKKKAGKAGLENIDNVDVAEICGYMKDGNPTKAGILLSGTAPQWTYPEMVVEAVVWPELNRGKYSGRKQFVNSKRIEGTLFDMAKAAEEFVSDNIVKTENPAYANYENKVYDLEIPENTVKEAIINSLIHRAYDNASISSPNSIEIFPNRIEITNPGTIKGGHSVRDIETVNISEIRNPIIASSFELMGLSDNKCSGLQQMIQEMRNAGLPDPVFDISDDSFKVTLFRKSFGTNAPANGESHYYAQGYSEESGKTKSRIKPTEEEILNLCETPKSRQEITDYFGYASPTIFVNKYVEPLVQEGKISLSDPDNFSSRHQRFLTVDKD